MRFLGQSHPPEPTTAREKRVHAVLDKVQTGTVEAQRLSRAWQEVQRAEQVLADNRRRSHE